MDRARLQRRAALLPLLLCPLAFLVHLVALRRHAVDLPFWDEWDLLRPDGLPRGLSASWLWAQHNEHRIPLTKLQVWLLARVDGWNLITHQTLNFLLWGGLLAALGVYLRRRGLGTAAVGGLLLLLLSPANWANHGWGFQSQMHFLLLGVVLAVWGLFSARPGLAPRSLGLLGLLLALLSSAAGLGAVAAVLALYWFQSGARLAGEQGAAQGRERLARLGVALVGSLALVGWAWGWERGAQEPTGPHTLGFWTFLGDLVGLAWGYQTRSPLWGGLLLLLSLTPLALAARAARRGERAPPWEEAAALGALLAVLVLVAVGRGAVPGRAKSPRYLELGWLLVPYTALAWHRLLAARPRAAHAAVGAVLCLAGLGLADDWTLDGYRQLEARKRAGLRCLRADVRDAAGRLRCNEVYEGEDLAPLLAEARALRLSFTAALPTPP